MSLHVVVDPGHGGRDQGAVVGTAREAEIVLPFAFALGAELFEAGHHARFTRMRNIDLGPRDDPKWKSKDLRARCMFANGWPADVFLSLHCNASSSHLANGAWVLHDDDTVRGIPLARCIFRELAKIPGIPDSDPAEEVYPDNSPWTGGREIYVLGGTTMPAALIELGFLTNAMDLEQLQQSETKLQVAKAIVRGLDAWERGEQ